MFEIGNTLREARVRRKITLQQAEDDTKIRVKYIQAMENEDFGIMPGATYVKGFLRTYSTYLSLDPDVIVEEYQSRTHAHAEQPEPFGGSSIIGLPRSHRGRNTVLFVAVLCLLVLAVIYILDIGGGPDGGTPITQPSALGITTSPSASVSASPSPTQSAGAVADQVNIRAVADAWVEVRRRNSTGKVLFSGTLKSGQSKTYAGNILWLRLGSPANVRLRIEGRSIRVLRDAGPSDYRIQDGRLRKQG